MEKPEFPLASGRYLVTGDREVTTVLTVEDDDGSWALADGATLLDVTHLPCRAARYTPVDGPDAGSPANATLSDFPVTPGALMPAVIFVLAIAEPDESDESNKSGGGGGGGNL